MKKCKCGIPVSLLEFSGGERLWHHTPIIGIHDKSGVILDMNQAYFYCSSGKSLLKKR